MAAFEALLGLDPGLDGVFVGNDQMALGVLRVAHARGIAVPDDLAVVGFDGLDEGAQFTPSLTTVVQPLRELGELAVREVTAATSDRSDASAIRTQVLATQLVVRESAPAIPVTATVASEPSARAHTRAASRTSASTG